MRLYLNRPYAFLSAGWQHLPVLRRKLKLIRSIAFRFLQAAKTNCTISRL